MQGVERGEWSCCVAAAAVAADAAWHGDDGRTGAACGGGLSREPADACKPANLRRGARRGRRCGR
jgi:Na+-transporting NADH:ubiquinone oxidoreductase subunit NqrB